MCVCRLARLFSVPLLAQTRYVWKYRSSDNEIVLRVTDDNVAYQYKTSLSHELKLMEAWNLIMLKLCTSKKPDANQVMQEIGQSTSREATKPGE